MMSLFDARASAVARELDVEQLDINRLEFRASNLLRLFHMHRRIMRCRCGAAAVLATWGSRVADEASDIQVSRTGPWRCAVY